MAAARILCRKGRVASAAHITLGRSAGLLEPLMVRKLEEAGGPPSMAAANHSDGRKFFHVDTLAKVRELEAQGVPSKQAEAIILAITEMQQDCLKDMVQSSIFKADIQKDEMILDTKLSKLKSEVLRSQATHFSLMQEEHAGVRFCIEKIRDESRHKLDRVVGQHRLDLEKFKSELYQEIRATNAHIKESKYMVVKYCIATLLSLSACGAFFRFAI